MAINLSIIDIVNTPSQGAAQTWLEAPGEGAIWFQPAPVGLGASIVVVAFGDDSVSFNDLLVRTQQVEAALSNPATAIGVAWEGVVVLDAASLLPVNRPGDTVNRIKRIVPSLYGPAAPAARLNVYWSA